MPLNESLAWGYVEIPYQTVNAQHRVKFHVQEMNANGIWNTANVPQLEASIEDTVEHFLEAMSAFIPTGTTFGTFDVFKNHPDPTPTEFWYSGAVPTLSPTPAGTNTAAAYQIFVFKTAKRRRANIEFFDVGDAKPQRFNYSDLGAGAKAAMDYVVANFNIVTIDGEAITTPSTVNAGYNKRLARKYGRIDTP